MKKNVVWNTVGSVYYCMCQWLITILVVRLDSFESSGQLSLAMTTSSSFSAISLFSMRQFQVSDVQEEYLDREYYGSRIITCISAQIACMLYAVFMVNTSNSYWCVVLFMLVRLAEAFVDVFHAINQKFDRYDLIGKSFLLRGTLTLISFTLTLVITHDLLITLAIVSILNLLVAFGFDRIKTGELEDVTPLINKRVFQLILTCVPLVIFSFLLSMENLIPKNLLESIYGVEELGIYASIASPTLVVQVVASVVFTPFLPRFTKMYLEGELDVFKKTFHNIILALGTLGVIVILGASILGRLGLRVLFGEMILEYYYLFMPIVLCTLLTAMIWIISSIVIAIRQIKKLLIGIVLDFGLCMCIAKPIVEQYNKNGVSIVQIISYTFLIVYMIIICEASVIYTQKKRGKKL